jgi:hypothetical protein
MKQYVKVFVYMSTLFMLYQFISNLGERTIVDTSIYAAKSGLLFGGLSILFIIPMYKLSGKKPGDSVSVSESMVVDLPYSEAFTKCLQSVQIVGKHKFIKNDESQGMIEIKSDVSFRSWGEKVAYTLQPVDEHYTCITIESKPWMSLTLEDWGKNDDNVKQIMVYMKRGKKYPFSA